MNTRVFVYEQEINKDFSLFYIFFIFSIFYIFSISPLLSLHREQTAVEVEDLLSEEEGVSRLYPV